MTYVRPDTEALLAMLAAQPGPGFHEMEPGPAREMMRMMAQMTERPRGDLAEVKDIAIPGTHGHSIPARLYRDSVATDAAPVLLFFHGGGWVIGDLDSHDVVCRTLAVQGEMIVISVDYRLAPEHKFPAAIDDALAATQWIADNAIQLNIDASRISVGGDSAGGNLAAIVAIEARERGLTLRGQLLIYPATDVRMNHPSHSEPETDCLLSHTVMRWFRDHYLNDAGDIDNWRASPARAEDLSGLPPAFVLTAGADPLRDEGNEYARRLSEAGVEVAYQTYPGQFHGFVTMGKILPMANEALHAIGIWLKALG
jgi:acetyl esterase